MSVRGIVLALLVASCGSSSSGGSGDGGSLDAPLEAGGRDAPSGKHLDSGSPRDASGDARDATPDSPRPPPVTTWSADLANGTIPAVAVDASSHTLALGLVTAAGLQSLVFDAFDPAGAALWSHSVVASGGAGDGGDAGSGGAAASGVAVDAKGTALFTATTAAAADFGGGTLAPGGLVVAYDTGGDPVFSHTYPGATARAAAPTAAGGWVVVGSFAGAVDFGGGKVNAPSPRAMFVLGLDAKGNFGGLATFPSAGDASSAGDVDPSRVAIDPSGAIFIAGSFDGDVDLGGGKRLVGPARASGDTAAFVLKLDASMAYAAQVSLHVSGSDAVTGLALDATGAPFVCGQFDQTIDCGGGHVPAKGTEDVFLCKLSSTLGYGWGETFGDPGFAELVSADAVDPAGNVYIAGSLTGSVSFGGGLLSSAGYGVYVAKYTSAGAYVTGGIVGATVSAAALGLAAPSTGSSEVIAGQFQGSIDFGQGVFASGDGGTGAGFVAWWVL